MSASIPRELSAGGGKVVQFSFDPRGQRLNIYVFLQMSKTNKADSLQEIKDSTIQEILLPRKRGRKDTEKDSYHAALDMLATSSAHDSGSDSIGENPMIKPTPPDAHAHVKVGPKGKLVFSTESIADENKELREMVKALQSQLAEASKSPMDHPEPSPAKDALTGGLESFLSEEQFNSFCKSVGAQIAAAVKPGQISSISPVLPVHSDTSGPSKALTSHVQAPGKESTRVSQRDILGTSMGPVDSEDDLGDFSSGEQEG